MLCCVSRKSSTRPNSRNNKKQQNPIDSNRSESSSGFSESSSVSSGDFASSGFSGGSSSSSSTSGISSATPASLGAFACSSSDSNTSGFEFSNRFDVSPNYSGNSSTLEPVFDVRAFDTRSASFSTSVNDFSNAAFPRLQTFLPPASVRVKSSDADGNLIVDREIPDKDEPPVLLPCAICTRTFMPQSLEKHRRICERAAIKKRKPFDSAKQRIQGTDLAEFLPKETTKKKVYQEEKPMAVSSKGSWKQTHDEFIRAIQAAREETTDAPPQRQSVATNQVTVGVPTRPNEKGMCPTCNRLFSIKAYERHVAWCKERVTRMPINTVSNVAKERLEARMKYRAPLLKNRRITNREKYSPASAINLPSHGTKNSIANSRAKESASTPNCNSKGENESATGCHTHSHQKPTTNDRRPSQGPEGISSGPVKSRISDRSSRPSAEVEFGPTTNLSSCPIVPSINEHQHLPLLLKRAILSTDAESPIPTSRSVSKPGSRRLASRECESFRKISHDGCRIGIDRRAIELNIFDGSKNYRKENIVSARSNGHPKVNDVSINDELVGMTVHSCGRQENDKNDAEKILVTWKQISKDNMMKHTKSLESNDERNVEKCGQDMTIAEPEPTVGNKSLCGIKSDRDFKISATSSIKNLNKTYLIRESLDTHESLSEKLGRRMGRPVVNSPRTDSNSATETPRKHGFGHFASVPMSSSGQCSGESEEGYENNMNRALSLVSSEQAKFAPLDLKMIDNDEMSDREDTSRSAGSTVSSLQTCRRPVKGRSPKLTPIMDRETIIGKPMNLKAIEKNYYENLENRGNCCQVSGDIGSIVNRDNTPRINSKSETKIDGGPQLGFRSGNEENTGSENWYGDNEVKFSIEESKRFEKTSTSLEVKTNTIIELDNNEPLDSTFVNAEDDSRVDCLWKIVDNVDEKISIEKNNDTSETLRSFQSTVTPTNACNESMQKKIAKMRLVDERAQVYDEEVSESLDPYNSQTMVNSCHSIEDRHHKINFHIFESLDTPRSARDTAAAIENCCSSSPKEMPKLLANPESPFDESLNDISRSASKDDLLINSRYSFSEVDVSEKKIKNCFIGAVENTFSNCVEKSSETPSETVEQSLVKPVETLKDSLIFEEPKDTAIEQTGNYQRCGTYVIERLPNVDISTKHPVSDEFLDEKPLLKRRRTDQRATNDRIKKSLMFNKAPEENRIKDSISMGKEKNWTKLSNHRSDYRVESAKKNQCPQSKMKLIDQNVNIDEKYVNKNFDYESDNGDNNLVKDEGAEVSSTQEKLSISDDTSSCDLHPKAFSDSILPRQTGSVIALSKCEKERGSQDPSKITKKLKKKMSLLRSSTDTLISSAEACDKIIIEKSSCIPETCGIDKTLRIEEETIREINFETIGKIAATKTRYRGFFPEITIDCAITKTDDGKEKNIVPPDGNCLWKKDKRNLSPRLINLDPPKFRETRVKNTRQSNAGNLPPVVPASFRKIGRRSSYRESRASWSNYVRRRPDFNLVLTGRTGSCKDYDPYVLAERQMNELISDTCSDQSVTDYPTNVRDSSSSSSGPNYPLSHSSAFVKYPNPVTRHLNNLNNRVSLIAPPSEFDDLAAGFSSDSTETNSISREILTDLEDSRSREKLHDRDNKTKDSRDHVLGRRVIIDKSKALGTNEIIQDSGSKNLQTNDKARKFFDKVALKIVKPHVTRSNSVRATSAPKAPERKNNNSSVTATNKINSRSNPASGLNNRNNNYESLSGSNLSLSSIVSSEVEVKRSNSLFDELASSFEDDASCAYPSLRSLLKNDSLSVSSPVQSNRPRNGIISDEELSSPDSYKRQDHSKLSADSAYSSLNRKYSNHGRNTNEEAGRQEDDSLQRRRDGNVGPTSSAKCKLSKFCHECGCKFPETAKYCCECGIRRLTL